MLYDVDNIWPTCCNLLWVYNFLSTANNLYVHTLHDLAPNSIKMRHMIFFYSCWGALFSLSNWIRGGEILMDFLRGSSHLLVSDDDMKHEYEKRYIFTLYVHKIFKECSISVEKMYNKWWIWSKQIRQCEIFFRKFLALIYFIGHHYDFQIFTWACIFGAKSWYYLSFSNL